MAIDVDTGDFEVAEDTLAVSERLLASHPDAQIWCVRIGCPAVHRAADAGFARRDRDSGPGPSESFTLSGPGYPLSGCSPVPARRELRFTYPPIILPRVIDIRIAAPFMPGQCLKKRTPALLSRRNHPQRPKKRTRPSANLLKAYDLASAASGKLSSQRQALKALAAISRAEKKRQPRVIAGNAAARSAKASGKGAARCANRGKRSRTGPVWRASGPLVSEALGLMNSVDETLRTLVSRGVAEEFWRLGPRGASLDARRTAGARQYDQCDKRVA